MVVTLSGENSFGLRHELRRLIDIFVAEYGELALERLDGPEAAFSKISEALTSLPFLANKKMVVLRTPSTNKTFIEQVEQLLDNLPETTDLVIIEPKLDKRLSYYKFLKQATDFRYFPELDSRALESWLTLTATGQGGTLSSADAHYLVDRVGANQQLLCNELDKLLLYDPTITRRTINLLTDVAPQSTIFQLLEAAFAGHAKHALDLYGQQRALKVEPTQIIAMLAWQLHIIAIIKTANDRTIDQITSEAKINPYVVNKSVALARHLTLAKLKELVRDLLAIDLKTKRTPLDPDEALPHYLLTLAQ